jgi:CheY-like chemotaxis protein
MRSIESGRGSPLSQVKRGVHASPLFDDAVMDCVGRFDLVLSDVMMPGSMDGIGYSSLA